MEKQLALMRQDLDACVVELNSVVEDDEGWVTTHILLAIRELTREIARIEAAQAADRTELF